MYFQDLAKRLALTFGIETTKEHIRKSIINLHRYINVYSLTIQPSKLYY